MFEQRRDLGETRLTRLAAVTVMLLIIGGAGLMAFNSDAHWKSLGALANGLGIGLMCGPKLAIWRA